jgi:alkaline phosphatase
MTAGTGRWRLRGVMAGVAVAAVALPAAALAVNADGDRTEAAREAIVGGRARNVILLIGDGMGDSEITSARNYARGAAGRLALDTLPLTGSYTTYSLSREAPHRPEYVTDSAASATGWSTGRKTYNGAIGVDVDGRPAPSLLQLAQRAGFRTGDVTTADITDATPAAQVAHVSNRDCQGPQSMQTCPEEAKEKGGLGSIAEQFLDVRPDVVLGGGRGFFHEELQAGASAGRSVWDQAAKAGYRRVTDATGLAQAGPEKPLLGLFAEKNMDLEWVGPLAAPQGTEPQRCAPNSDRDRSQPRLRDMTWKALHLLDQRTARTRGKGFFLQVEGASIDKQNHAANPCGQIGETVGFDAAVAEVLRYQAKNPDTLVIVTADHGHTSQIVEAGARTMGATATLITADGAPMTISYATAPLSESQLHTGTQVRIAAKGPQAANILGVTNQTDLFTTIRRALGV